VSLDTYWTVAPLILAAAGGVVTAIVLWLTRDRHPKAGE
jgi:hypothetical protein